MAYKHTRRPYVFINMVSSADGKATLKGKASGLGTEADRGVMRTLRSRADAVMVGGGTLRAEKLSLGLDAGDPRPRPLAVIVTNTGDVPLGRNLVLDPRQDVLALLPDGADEDTEQNLGRIARVRRVPAARTPAGREIDLSKALSVLKDEYGIAHLLCEGGPTLNRALIRADLADELFVTVAPVLIGQEASGASDARRGPPEDTKALRLISARPVGDELFLRYAIDAHRHAV